MPDGEVRIYCTRINSVISYFVADEDGGGSTLIVEPAAGVMWSEDQLTSVLQAMRQSVLEEVAGRLNCHPDKVEFRSISDLTLITDEPEQPRHPWEFKRSPSIKRLSR